MTLIEWLWIAYLSTIIVGYLALEIYFVYQTYRNSGHL